MKNMKRNVQQGFTLIELMIVIAIVAILVALAVPAYQDYTTRAKFAECIGAAAPVKLSVAEYRQTMSAWPSSAQAGVNSETTGNCAAMTYASGAITVTSATDSGVKAVLTPTAQSSGSVTWACTNGGTAAKAKFLPSTCRTGGST